MINLKYFFYKAIKVGIFISLLTPLVVGEFGLTFSAFPKAIFFNSLIELIFIFYVGLVLLDRKFLPKLNIVLISLFVYEAVLFTTSIFGVSFSRSFFGDPERAEGLILHLHLIIFLIVICSIYRTKKDWIFLMKIIAGVSAVSSLVAVGQKFGLWTLYGVSLPSRVSGTMSNPDFFAPYVISAFFISLFIFFSEKEKDLKFLWLFIAGLNLIGLVLSGTRGAWVGFIAGMVVFLGYLTIRFYLKARYNVRLMMLFAFLFIFIFFLIIFSSPEKFNLRGNYYFETFYSMFELDLGSRKDVWELSINGWKDRPIIGWGTESISYVFDKYFKAEHSRFIPERMYFDHPHNKLIELLVVSGVLGLLSYLFLFSAVIYCIFKYNQSWQEINKRDKNIYSIIIFCFFVAYFFQNLFFFDTISNFILFFFAVGFVASTFKAKEDEVVNIEYKTFTTPQWIIFIITCLLVFCFFYKANFQPISSAIWFPKFAVYESSEPRKAIDGYENALNDDTVYKKDFELTFIERLLFMIENRSVDEGVANKITDTLLILKPNIEKNLKTSYRRPVNTYEYLARIDERAFLKSDDFSRLDAMQKTLNDAISFNPEIAVFYQLMGEAEMLRKNYKLGEEYFAKTYELSMKTSSDEELLYRKIGVGYQKAGNSEMAFKNYDKAINTNYNSRRFLDDGVKLSVNNGYGEYLSFAEAVAVKYCRDFKNKEKCSGIYQKLMESYPGYKESLKSHLDFLLKTYF